MLHIWAPTTFKERQAMTEQNTAADAEFAAIHTVYTALEALEDDARSRVLNYIISRLEIAAQTPKAARPSDPVEANSDDAALKEEEAEAPKYGSFAELFDAAQPKSNADKALVAGYWLQVCQGTENFDGQSANKELKHLGEGLANITAAVESLKTQKPALALQLKKSGKSQQARKTYKVTVAGIKAVEAMING
jgi:hypothetical protein